MTDNISYKFSFILVGLILLITASICLNENALYSIEVTKKSGETTLNKNESCNPMVNNQRTIAKGEFLQPEKVAELPDNSTALEKKVQRKQSFFCTVKCTAYLTSMHSQSSKLLGSSHLGPSTILRI